MIIGRIRISRDIGDWNVFCLHFTTAVVGLIDRDVGLRMYNMQHVLHFSILLDMWQWLLQAAANENWDTRCNSKRGVYYQEEPGHWISRILCELSSNVLEPCKPSGIN